MGLDRIEAREAPNGNLSLYYIDEGWLWNGYPVYIGEFNPNDSRMIVTNGQYQVIIAKVRSEVDGWGTTGNWSNWFCENQHDFDYPNLINLSESAGIHSGYENRYYEVRQEAFGSAREIVIDYATAGAGAGLRGAARAGTAVSTSLPRIGHTTPWGQMSVAERRAFQHSYSRHAAELGLPNWSQRNAENLQSQFNSVVGHIRECGTEISNVRKPFNGNMVEVRYWEYSAGGKKYYYYEDMAGTFISAGLSTR